MRTKGEFEYVQMQMSLKQLELQPPGNYAEGTHGKSRLIGFLE